MSEEQAASVRTPLDVKYKQNARPIQALNGRTVEVFDIKRLTKHTEY